MNLVIDDAVEVKLATKGESESRRELGRDFCAERVNRERDANSLSQGKYY